MAETVKEFANIGIVEMDRLLGAQRKYISRIAKGPLKLVDWYEFVENVVRWNMQDDGYTNVDSPQVYAIWLRASITFIEMGKIVMPPPKEPKRPERA